MKHSTSSPFSALTATPTIDDFASNPQPAPTSVAGALSLPIMAASGGSALSLKELTLSQNFGAIAGVKKALVTVPIRKPSNQAYVRVHPEAQWRFQAAILQLKDDGECYLIVPALYPELANEVRPKMLYTAVNRDGSVFLWPVNMPGDDGRLDSWSESAHVAAGMAQSDWIRLVANRTVGAYDVMQAANLAEVPQWPDKTFEEVVTIAFKGRVIDSLEHPILRRLRGEL